MILRDVVHELEPILGLLRIHALKEIEDCEDSKVWKELDRFEKVLERINP